MAFRKSPSTVASQAKARKAEAKMKRSKLAKDTAATKLKRLEAIKLRASGLQYQEIAEELGVSKAEAHRRVMAALEIVRDEFKEAAALALPLELARLDELQAAIYPAALEGDTGAMDRVLAIMTRRQKLLGMEPKEEKAGVTVNLTVGRMTDGELVAEARRLGLPVPNELTALPPPIEDAEYVPAGQS